MTYYIVMGTIILAGLGATVWFFRRGGIYNPIEAPDIPLEPPKTPQETSTDGGIEIHPKPPGLLWDTPQNARHSVRVICDEEGLTWEQKNTLCATVGAESGWRPGAIGKPNVDGTRDYGIAQINSYWWIGEGKQFPSTEYVLENPAACIRWMCKQWKLGHRNWWVAYKNGSYKRYL